MPLVMEVLEVLEPQERQERPALAALHVRLKKTCVTPGRVEKHSIVLGRYGTLQCYLCHQTILLTFVLYTLVSTPDC